MRVRREINRKDAWEAKKSQRKSKVVKVKGPKKENEWSCS